MRGISPKYTGIFSPMKLRVRRASASSLEWTEPRPPVQINWVGIKRLRLYVFWFFKRNENESKGFWRIHCAPKKRRWSFFFFPATEENNSNSSKRPWVQKVLTLFFWFSTKSGSLGVKRLRRIFYLKFFRLRTSRAEVLQKYKKGGVENFFCSTLSREAILRTSKGLWPALLATDQGIVASGLWNFWSARSRLRSWSERSDERSSWPALLVTWMKFQGPELRWVNFIVPDSRQHASTAGMVNSSLRDTESGQPDDDQDSLRSRLWQLRWSGSWVILDAVYVLDFGR